LASSVDDISSLYIDIYGLHTTSQNLMASRFSSNCILPYSSLLHFYQ